MSAVVVMYSPLQSRLERRGARFADRRGWSEARVFTSPEAEAAQARKGIALADESARGKLLIQGSEAAELLASVLEAPAPDIQQGHGLARGFLYRLRHDLFFASTEPAAQEDLAADLVAATGDGFVTVTDITHGRSELRLVGPRVADLMSKVCALDLTAADRDGGLWARQTSVAKTRQLVVSRTTGSVPAYAVIGGRATAAYVWDVLMEAGEEFEIVPMGRAALQMLERDE